MAAAQPAGQLTLRRVRVVQTGRPAKQAPGDRRRRDRLGARAGRCRVRREQQAGDAAIGAVNAGGPPSIRDPKITTTSVGDSAALYARGPRRSSARPSPRRSEPRLRAARRRTTPRSRSRSTHSSVLRAAARRRASTSAPRRPGSRLRGVTISPATASTGRSVDLNRTSPRHSPGDVDSSLLLAAASASRTATLATAPSQRANGRQFSGQHVLPDAPTATPTGNTKLTRASCGSARTWHRHGTRPRSTREHRGRRHGRIGGRPPRPPPRRRPATTAATRARASRQGRVRALPAAPQVAITGLTRWPAGRRGVRRRHRLAGLV